MTRAWAFVSAMTFLSWAGGTSAQSIEVEVRVSQDRVFEPIQSYLVGETDTGLLFFSGMRDIGLHGFGSNGFRATRFNRLIVLVDRATGDVMTSDMDLLSRDVHEALTTVGATSIQFGDDLFLYGGYGPVPPDDTAYTTRATVTTIDLPAVEADIRQYGQVQPGSITVDTSKEAQVAGAATVPLSDGDRFALVCGANAQGLYPNGNEPVYSNEIHIFDRTVSMADPVLTLDDGLGENSPLHRRDLNALPVTLPAKGGGTRDGLIVVCGVFQDDIFAWENPLIWGDGDKQVFMDEFFTQHSGTYHGGVASFYSESLRTNYVLNTSGLSAYEWSDNEWIWNPAVPWTREITEMSIVDGVFTSEYIIGEMPWPLVSTHLVLEPDLPVTANRQVLYDDLPRDTPILLGRMYGGIAAEATGDQSPTYASDEVYDVFITIPDDSRERAPLSRFAVREGWVVSGSIDDVREADDEYLVINSSPSPEAFFGNLIKANLRFDSPDPSARNLTLTVEAALDHPGGQAAVEIYNFTTRAWDHLARYDMGVTEQRWTLANIDATDRVRASDGRVRLRITQWVVATFTVTGFQSWIDQVELIVH